MRREGKKTLHEYPRCFACRFTLESGVRVTQEESVLEQDDVKTHRRDVWCSCATLDATGIALDQT